MVYYAARHLRSACPTRSKHLSPLHAENDRVPTPTLEFQLWRLLQDMTRYQRKICGKLLKKNHSRDRASGPHTPPPGTVPEWTWPRSWQKVPRNGQALDTEAGRGTPLARTKNISYFEDICTKKFRFELLKCTTFCTIFFRTKCGTFGVRFP